MRKALLMSMLIPALALAAEGEALKQGIMYLGASLAIGLAAFGAGIGMGYLLKGTQEGMARNPTVGGRLQTTMFIGLAFLETLALYGLLVAIIILFVK
ncbi:ATP synthase F0 subunit C [Thermocrinis sp.]|jgi:F-type H+-transporting ATPase subunit c|uniref:ATP synthase F0 subunit C n=1 Tax=Thermocrinis sp. TaxID=2024383 RepID=UPI002631A639|nr:ATP synthase F0 subunit C [Thermocrinis sp.]